MKKYRLKYATLFSSIGAICILLLGCERGFSDEVELATFPSNGDIYTDAPIGLFIGIRKNIK